MRFLQSRTSTLPRPLIAGLSMTLAVVAACGLLVFALGFVGGESSVAMAAECKVYITDCAKESCSNTDANVYLCDSKSSSDCPTTTKFNGCTRTSCPRGSCSDTTYNVHLTSCNKGSCSATDANVYRGDVSW